MNFTTLFNIVDGIIGESSTFKGLTFLLDDGVLTVDLFESGIVGGDVSFLCEFVPHNAPYPISFAAVNVDELREQIEHYTKA